MIRYELGMELALVEPNMTTMPDYWTRESLLASVGKQASMAEDGDYELRMILRHDVDVDCPHDVTEGEMLFMVGAGRGGPIEPKDLIAEADRLGRSGTLDDSFASTFSAPAGTKRLLVLPLWCDPQWVKLPEGNPLHGACFVGNRDVMKPIDDFEPSPSLEHLQKLLAYSRRSLVVISACFSA